MRVYISADIEGVGGIAHLASTGPKRIDWETSARQWMTNEVLAAIAACDAAGANEYVITDGHGSAHNLLIDSFPDNSRLIRSWPRPLLQMEAIDQGHYDAAIFIGHHASATMAGGILAHSFTIAEIAPRLFSFNAPQGACPDCDGLGEREEFDPQLVVPNEHLSLKKGAIVPWAKSNPPSPYYMQVLSSLAKAYGFSLDSTWEDLLP